MKNKIILVLAVAFLLPLALNAQKLKDYKLGNFNWTQLPKEPLPKEYNTYNVTARSSVNEYRADKIKNAIKIDGYEKLSDGAGDFTVKLAEKSILFGSTEQKIEARTVKKDGVEKKVNYYSYTNVYTHEISMKVYNGAGELILERKLLDQKKEFSTDQFTTSKAAWDSYKETKNKLIDAILVNKMKDLNGFLNDRIGYPKKSFYLTFQQAVVKRKRDYNYDDFDKALALAAEGIKILMTNEDDLDAASEKINPAKEIWVKMLEESDLDNKKARVNEKVTLALYFNLLICEFTQRNYEEAIAYAEKIEPITRNFHWFYAIKAKAVERQKRKEANM